MADSLRAKPAALADSFLSMTNTAPPVSAAEQSPSARLGGVLFRNRSWIPVPFLAIPLLAPGRMSAGNWIIGALLVAAGETLRLAGVAAAGTATRRRSRDVQRLVTYGVFGWVRNPLYVGNFLIWMGFTVISGVYWFLPITALLFALEYTLIVRYEEGVLESIFGSSYLAYKSRTPRWLPRPPRPADRDSGPHDWRQAVRSETSTFMAYAALVVALAVKHWLTRE
jgi:protein-S-isoprenylcysteine O-methyltransferase Ste14